MSKDADLRQLIEAGFTKLAGDMAAGFANVKDEFAGVKDEFAGVKDEFAGVKERLARIEARLDAQDKRLDDQSRLMTALIPQKIAAVGDKKAG
jgi:Skp family chaperone for outer membrane proteins